MEGADVELRTELLQLAQLISAGLCRPRDASVGLRLNKPLVDVVLVHILDHLITRPSLRMNACVDNQANGAKEYQTFAELGEKIASKPICKDNSILLFPSKFPSVLMQHHRRRLPISVHYKFNLRIDDLKKELRLGFRKKWELTLMCRLGHQLIALKCKSIAEARR